MVLHNTDDLRIKNIRELLPPIALLEKYPLSEEASDVVACQRADIANQLAGKDDRLLVVIGPCSIHDTDAAMDYAKRLLPLREKFADQLSIVMRVYFEKPRTTVGWKGLINDPHLDDSYDINEGLRKARKLLSDINDLGLPTAGEFLDMITPQYIADLMAWGAIGARTTESQGHRQLASGLSCPVGFKNGTDGNIKIAMDAIGAAAGQHHFLSVTKYGHAAIVETAGNDHCHVILRGGKEPNYSEAHVKATEEKLEASGLPKKIMIDFSHANSSKQFKRQLDVCEDVSTQIENGNDSVFGVMVESHINEGAQKVVAGQELEYGKSITDSCIGWADTEALLARLAEAVENRRK